MSSFKLDVEEKNGILQMRVTGRLDYETATDFNQQVNDKIHKKIKSVVLNFEGLNFISSAGLGALINISREFQKRDGIIRITSMNANVAKIFDLRGLDTFFEIENKSAS